MRILFYEDPIIDPNNFLMSGAHIGRDAVLYHSLKASNCDCRVLLDRRFERWAHDEDLTPADLIIVNEARFQSQLSNPQQAVNTIFQRYLPVNESACGENGNFEAPDVSTEYAERTRMAERLVERFSRVIGEALAGFVPDIIFTWVPAPFLRHLFPDALLLHRESGVFTRCPYPESFPFDPCGQYKRSWPARFPAVSGHQAALNGATRLRQYFAQIFQLAEPVAAAPELLARFKHRVLLIGQVSGHHSYDGTCPYRSQTHMLVDVLRSAPPNCAVIYTQHPETPKPLNAVEVSRLQDEFPNLFLEQQFNARYALSQQLLHYVDAVATVTSTLGWQSVFWGKPLIALGKGQLNAYAQAESVVEIEDVLRQPAPDAMATAAWLAFHYCIPEPYLRQSTWITNYLQGRLAHWRQFGATNYFSEPYAPPAQVAEAFIGASRSTLSSFLGAPIDTCGSAPIDFADSLRFGPGWSYHENAGGKSYRWVEGTRAHLRLAVQNARDLSLSFVLGTHDGCPAQAVSVYAEDHMLATTTIVAGKSTALNVQVPKQLVTVPLTTIRLQATQAVAPTDKAGKPTGDKRRLSVICSNLSACAL